MHPLAQETLQPLASPAPPAAGVHALDLLELAIALAAPVALAILWLRGIIGPGALKRAGLRDLSPFPWWFYILCAALMPVAQLVGAAAGLMVRAPQGSILQDAAVQTGAGLAAIAAGLMLIRIVRLGGRRPGERPGGSIPEGFDLAPRRHDLRRALLAFVAALPLVAAASILATLLVYLLTGKPPPPVAHDTLQKISEHRGEPAAWVLVAGAVLLAPIGEELAFRVFLQSGLLALLRRPWLAVTITSAIFAAIHLGSGVPADQPEALIPLFVLALAMGTAYERTRRPWVPILMHALFNAANVAAVAAM